MMQTPPMRILVRLLLIGLGGYVVLCGLVFLQQRRMLYFPDRMDVAEGLRVAKAEGLEPFQDRAGQVLGWRSRLPGARATLVVLHGNAGHALHRTYFRDQYQVPDLGVPLDVVLLEYPGYGVREGAPTEEALVGSTVAALELLRAEPSPPVVLVGESLGSAVAVLAAARRPDLVRGLMLITPMKSATAVARRHYPFLPTFLLRDTFRADRALPSLHLPVAFLVAGQDEVVFPDLGRELYQAYPGPKRMWEAPEARHNTLDHRPGQARTREMVGFAVREMAHGGISRVSGGKQP